MRIFPTSKVEKQAEQETSLTNFDVTGNAETSH